MATSSQVKLDKNPSNKSSDTLPSLSIDAAREVDIHRNFRRHQDPVKTCEEDRLDRTKLTDQSK